MLSRLVKASPFTRTLTPDPLVPSIEAAENASKELLRRARRVDGSFTWVAPEQRPKHVSRWISPAALRDLGIHESEAEDELFQNVMAGQHIMVDAAVGIYPWAQNYAGFQFGVWAGQLGDGRAISLFMIGNDEIQLKGAGTTPYSRFADGKAVLRSSIREALVSEALHALNIPTTRALSLTELPGTLARRERLETCAIVTRFAPSWIRIGTFNLHHARGNREELRKLADFCLNDLGLRDEALKYAKQDGANRYYGLFKAVALRNASMIAKCQAYGFLNGVLNTDNTSILGLSMDYGPFAFMDTFVRDWTPNHDDSEMRYGFRRTPLVMWWNMIRLVETLGELIGVGEKVDDVTFKKDGIHVDEQPAVLEKLQALAGVVASAYRTAYDKEYESLMAQRLGIRSNVPSTQWLKPTLDMLEETEVDYNQFIRRLGTYQPGQEKEFAARAVPEVRDFAPRLSRESAEAAISQWLVEIYRPNMADNRTISMNALNPSFVLKNWVLADVISRAEKGDWEAFNWVAQFALSPYDCDTSSAPEYVKAYFGDVPQENRGSTCSCSS